MIELQNHVFILVRGVVTNKNFKTKSPKMAQKGKTPFINGP
jgi:hypothetical protein